MPLTDLTRRQRRLIERNELSASILLHLIPRTPGLANDEAHRLVRTATQTRPFTDNLGNRKYIEIDHVLSIDFQDDNGPTLRTTLSVKGLIEAEVNRLRCYASQIALDCLAHPKLKDATAKIWVSFLCDALTWPEQNNETS